MLVAFQEPDPVTGEAAGLTAIRKTRDEDPPAYVKALTSLMPKELTGADGAPLLSGINVTFVKPKPEG